MGESLFLSFIIWVIISLLSSFSGTGIVSTFLISTTVTHWWCNTQKEFQTSWNQFFINVLTQLVLSFKFFNLIFIIFWLSILILFITAVVVDLFEQVKERFLFHLFCLLSSFFAFLLYDLYCNVLSLFPVNIITISFLYFSLFNIEMLGNFHVSEPFILWKVKVNWEFFQIFTLLSFNFNQMF